MCVFFQKGHILKEAKLILKKFKNFTLYLEFAMVIILEFVMVRIMMLEILLDANCEGSRNMYTCW